MSGAHKQLITLNVISHNHVSLSTIILNQLSWVGAMQGCYPFDYFYGYHMIIQLSFLSSTHSMIHLAGRQAHLS